MKCFGERSIQKVYLDRVIAEYGGDGLSASKVDHALTKDYEELVRRYLGPFQYFLHHAEPYFEAWKAKLSRRADR